MFLSLIRPHFYRRFTPQSCSTSCNAAEAAAASMGYGRSLCVPLKPATFPLTKATPTKLHDSRRRRAGLAGGLAACRPVVGAFHAVLRPEPQQLAAPVVDRGQPVLRLMPGTRENLIARTTSSTGKGIEPRINTSRVTIDWQLTGAKASQNFGCYASNIAGS